MLESLVALSRLNVRIVSGRSEAAAPSLRFAGDRADGRAYGEEAFHHFLEIERRRARRSGRPFLLLLVGLRANPGRRVRLSRAVTRTLFTGLGECMREVDFVGWYREHRVAAAVLAQGPQAPAADARVRVAERTLARLAASLPVETAAGLRVRVIALGGGGR